MDRVKWTVKRDGKAWDVVRFHQPPLPAPISTIMARCESREQARVLRNKMAARPEEPQQSEEQNAVSNATEDQCASSD